jgi:hypothetical protein
MRRLGGIDGNEALTAATAAVLTALLLAEGATIIDMGGLRTPHMFIGLLLIPPVLVKLASTGYRFVRYYAGTLAYREKGPPMTLLRMSAPLLVLTTIGIFATGVALIVVGHRSNTLIEVHKVSFILWSAVFGVHFLAHLPGMVRSLSRVRIPGARIRLALVAASVVAGIGLGVAFMPSITGWHGGDDHGEHHPG